MFLSVFLPFVCLSINFPIFDFLIFNLSYGLSDFLSVQTPESPIFKLSTHVINAKSPMNRASTRETILMPTEAEKTNA